MKNEQVYSYKLSKLTEDLRAEVVFKSTDYEDVQIFTGDIHRPGLQLADFYEHFEPTRIQLIGQMESAYMEGLPREVRLKKWETLLKHKVPALIMCHGADITGALLESAEKYDVTVLCSMAHTTETMSKVIRLVRRAIAPRLTRHGVLVEVYGVGMLLVGESGVGKSETAIELLKRGHRLIADDAVEIKAIDVNVIQGTAPELIRHYVELRGLGVIDVRQIFGSGAIKDYQNIHLVCNIELWRNDAEYERLGLSENTVDILGVKVPTVTIPVKPGRNLAVILEVAAMNQRQKFMGHNAAIEFTKQIDRHMDEKALEAVVADQDATMVALQKEFS
ncbi:MAG: HPr(Ser) kinase/phosphatase [Oscillospiraceae bacterium]|nr:HPr(Ser) kinase/phosphatase [Oscillospiraceae bacterium]